MEQNIPFGTVVSVRVSVAMPGQPRGRVLIVEWGPRVNQLVRLGRYELVEVLSDLPELPLPEPPAPQPDPLRQPTPEPDPPAQPSAAGSPSRRKASS